MLFESIPYRFLKQNFKLGNVKAQNIDILEYHTCVYTLNIHKKIQKIVKKNKSRNVCKQNVRVSEVFQLLLQ